MTATIGVISIGQDATFFTGRYFREILTVASQEVLGHDRHIRIVALTHAQGRTHASAEAALAEQGIDAALLVAPSEVFLEALQSRVNALSTDFVNRDDPFQRAKIAEDRQKALSEMERVKGEIDQLKKQIDDIEEEARKAGVPPGWLR